MAEAAEKYFVCDRTIRNWIKAGKLKAELIDNPEERRKGRFAKKWRIEKNNNYA